MHGIKRKRKKKKKSQMCFRVTYAKQKFQDPLDK